MAITKLQAESLNLADDFTFTGAVAGAGKVLQVVTGTYSTQEQTTSGTFVNSSLNVSITPSSASSKILIIAHNSIGTSDGGIITYITIDRSGTNLGNGNDGFMLLYNSAGGSYSNGSMTILDSPSTTSSITYTYQFRVGSGTGYVQLSNTRATMTAMEIAG